MKSITAREMKQIDQFTIKKIGLPAMVLMENAGRLVFEKSVEKYGNPAGRRVLIFCGKGGNGGDALVGARYFSRAGARVQIVLLSSPQELSAETAQNYKIVKNLRIKIFIPGLNLSSVKNFLKKTEFVIDGIFGFGFRGKVKGIYGRVIKLINKIGLNNKFLKIISIDVPSGLDATSGGVSGEAVRADLTVTLGWPKTGLLKDQARKFVGELKVVDIGLFEKKIPVVQKRETFSDVEEIGRILPKRAFDLHKTGAGRLLVIAGSRNMSGAAILAALAGLRAGAGLVSLAVPRSVQKIIAFKIPEIITYGMSESPEATWAAGAIREIKPQLKKCDALAIGPGLTTHPETQKFVLEFLKLWLAKFPKKPLVIDADALNILALNPKWAGDFLKSVKRKKAALILTPHSGELSRLIKKPVNFIENHREKISRELAKKWGVVLLLKGPRTVIAGPGGKISLNSTGSSVLASAGSGDVLTGIIASLAAQGLAPFNAARAGAFAHGLAAQIAEGEFGPRGIIARDIVETLPKAYNTILKN